MKRNFLASLPIAFIAIILNFVYKAWAAQIIDQETLGRFFTLIDGISFVMMIFIGFRSSMVASYAKYGDEKMILSVFALFIAIMGTLLSLVTWIGLENKKDAIFIIVMILSFSLYIYLSNQLSVYKLYALMNHLTFWEPVLLLAVFAIASTYFHLTGFSLLACATILSTLSLALLAGIGKLKYYGMTSWVKITFDEKTREFVIHSLMAALEFLAGMALVYLAVVILLLEGNFVAIAAFQVVTKSLLMYAIMLCIFPLFKFVLPEFASLYHQKRGEELEELLQWFKRYALIVGILAPVGWWQGGEALLGFAFPPSYHHAWDMVMTLSLFIGAMVYNGVMVAFLRGCGDFRATLMIRISGIFYFIGIYYSLKLLILSHQPLALSLGLSYFLMALMGHFMATKYRCTHHLNTINEKL